MPRLFREPFVTKEHNLPLAERVQLAYDLASWRRRHGYTLTEAGRKLGVYHRSLQFIEEGKQQPISGLLKRYLALLARMDDEEAHRRKPLPLIHTVTRVVDAPAPAPALTNETAVRAIVKPTSFDRAKPLPHRKVLANGSPQFEG